MEAPKDWPKEISDVYEPIRELGRGGFASVLLAQRKDDHKQQVAIKLVDSATKKQIGYAHREIDILRECKHPNIMQLLDVYQPPVDVPGASVMVLNFAKGPTLQALLLKGGRLSFPFCRVVGAQLIDVLAYLHSRAVIHRDIKPDNLVITGAFYSQDEIWDEVEGAPDYKALLKKWHVTLVDFGFARALSPEDMGKLAQARSKRNLDDSGGSLDKSISKRLMRKMSAVGARAFAAPEVQRNVSENMDLSHHQYSNHASVDVTKTLGETVSVYGLSADAYSVGNTLSFMFSGVHPDQNINDVIAEENSPLVMLCRLLCGGKSAASGDGKGENRRVQYRPISQFPAEVKKLIKGLTHRDPLLRTTMREARCYPWVDEIMDSDVPVSGKLNYLSFVLKKAATNGAATNGPAIIEEEGEE